MDFDMNTFEKQSEGGEYTMLKSYLTSGNKIFHFILKSRFDCISVLFLIRGEKYLGQIVWGDEIWTILPLFVKCGCDKIITK